MKIYGIPAHEIKEWSQERERLMTVHKKIWGMKIPEIKLVKMVVVDDLFQFIKGYECFGGDLPKELGDLKRLLITHNKRNLMGE